MAIKTPFKGPSSTSISERITQPKRNKSAAVGGGSLTDYTGSGFILTVTDTDGEDYIIVMGDDIDSPEYILIGD